MDKIPEFIKEICPSCNPRTYVKTKARYLGEVEDCVEHKEYLYKCVGCGAKMWANEEWVKLNEIK